MLMAKNLKCYELSQQIDKTNSFYKDEKALEHNQLVNMNLKEIKQLREEMLLVDLRLLDMKVKFQKLMSQFNSSLRPNLF